MLRLQVVLVKQVQPRYRQRSKNDAYTHGG